jgi:Calcineurin-like phosphoesterase
MKSTFLLMMLLVVPYVGEGATDTFIAANTKWKYLDDGTDQGTLWRANAFNDLAWATGNAELGYGDGDEATVVSFGANASAKYVTTYFRKAFNVVNPANYSSITFDLLVDDGAVVYLNGVEVYRQNMPTGNILFSTLASASAGSAGVPAENVWTTIPSTPTLLNALQVGRNVISVEVHQSSVSSSDISFNFRFTGQTTAISYIEANNVSWKYLDNGTDQGTAWRAISFNDGTWSSGNAELGYGDNDEETNVSFGSNASSKYITTYFRKAFSVASIPSALSLDLVCDDGAVVYLNGVEVYRQSMPSGTILYNTLASAAAGNPGVPSETTWTNVTLNPSSLVVGNNVITVEIHQGTITSSDISFNLRLTDNNFPAPRPLITRGAYLQMLSTNSIVVRWQTNIACDSKVDFGTLSATTQSVTDANLVTEHEVKLMGLSPNTKYLYQIGTTTTALQGNANNYFKTAIPLGTSDFTVWVTGDAGNGSAGQLAVRNSYLNYVGNNPANFWIWLGDNAYSTGLPSQYDSYVFNIYPEVLKNLPTFPSIGNHDYGNLAYQSTQTLGTNFEYFKAFTLPTNAEIGGVASGTEKYYSYNFGNAHFVVIDSYGSFNNSGSVMFNWLQADLQANTQKWIVCYFHHPPYTKGTHDSDYETESVNIRQNLTPLFEQYNVDLVLSGHSHVYERSYLLKGHTGIESSLQPSMVLNNTQGNTFPFYKKNTPAGTGTIYAVCGNSGQGGVVPTSGDFPHNAMATSYRIYHGSMLLDFKADSLIAKFLASDGTIQDNFKIVKKDCSNANLTESQITGDWTNTLTWGCGVVPSVTSIVTINKNHTVTINGTTQFVKRTYINGILKFMNNGILRFQP